MSPARPLLPAWLLWAALPATSQGEVSGAAVVSGTGSATYHLTAPGRVPSYSNGGFRQSVDEAGQLHVTVDADPGWTRARFELAAPGERTAVAAFARRAAAPARTRAEATALVLHQIRSRIGYQARGDLPEDPGDVLEASEASCVGLSNLAVAALETIGIPARIARGVLVDPTSGSSTPHRWIEVFYPDAGWVFSDPTESINYVSPYHVVLTPPAEPDPDYDVTEAASWVDSLVRDNDLLLVVDVRPGRPTPLAERRLVRGQFAATIHGVIVGRRRGCAVRLRGRSALREVLVKPHGRFAFAGLEPGHYVLEGLVEGSPVTRVPVNLLEGQLLRVEVPVR